MAYQDIYDEEMRRRKVHEAILQKSLQPGGTYNVSGRAVPYSPYEGLSQIGQALIARNAMNKGEDRLKAAREERESKQQEIIATAMGQPGVSESLMGPPEFPEGTQEITPAIAADPQRAALMASADPDTSSIAKVIAAMQPKPVKPTYKVVPEMQPSGKWRNREIIKGTKGELVGGEYTKGAGASDISLGGVDKYTEERMKKQAVRMDDLSKSAKSAYNESQALDRFISQAGDATAGGAQPIITGMKNFLSTFGYDDKSLTSVKIMEQAVGDMKVNKIAQFGARGLTDKDMEVIHQSLPRINTDPIARVEIAKILKKVHDREIQDYMFAREEETKKFPNMSEQIINPRWMREYKLNQAPEGVDKEIWDVMTLEERALWNTQ